ncbi:MAG TPA: flagellar biosynthesis protein FlhB [Candidatus Xenobia bacterium]|jgi:flagellar biosynthetic protein FliR/FlhB
MSEDSDKTEEPTEHKLQEARKKGQTFKSQEVTSTVMLLVCCGILMAMGGWMFQQILDYSRALWTNLDEYIRIENRSMFLDFADMTVLFFKVMGPMLAACVVAAIVANVAQVQFLFSTEPLNPSLSKINPIEGFKKIFAMKSIIELLKQVAKLTIIGWIVYKSVKEDLPKLSTMAGQDLTLVILTTKAIATGLIKKVLVGMAVISIVDYIFQKKNFMKEMKMSMQELKDEYKDTEGNPQVKAKLRQLMRQASQGQAKAKNAAKATAVVTNPTHLAVALKYEPGEDQAPMVMAKGERHQAVQIKLIAEDNDIPIIENVELARALFGACEPGTPVPPELYKATAEVLAYVFKLKKKKLARQKRAKMAGGRKKVAGSRP